MAYTILCHPPSYAHVCGDSNQFDDAKYPFVYAYWALIDNHVVEVCYVKSVIVCVHNAIRHCSHLSHLDSSLPPPLWVSLQVFVISQVELIDHARDKLVDSLEDMPC